MLDRLIVTLGIALALLTAIAADQKTKRHRYHERCAHDTGTRRALAKVVGVQTPVVHEDSDLGKSHSNPVRGPNVEKSQLLAFEVLTGDHRGRLVVAENLLHFRPAANAYLRTGSLVNVSLDIESGDVTAAMILKPIVRFPSLFLSGTGFLVAVILFAGVRGVRISASLLAAGGLTFAVLLPAVLRGYPPVLTVVLFALVLMGVTFALVGEINRKSLSAAAGAMGGLLSGLALTLIMCRVLSLTGLASTDAQFLQQFLPEGQHLNFGDLVIAGSVIAVLGIAIDVAVSVASGMDKLIEKNPQTTRLAAIRSGMRMASDIMGTTLLTLVFACLGVELHVLLLPKALPLSPQVLLNSEAGSIEIVQLLCGSIGLLLTGPLTAFSASWLLCGRPRREAKMEPGRRLRYCVIGVELLLVGVLATSICQDAAAAAAWPKDPEHLLLREVRGMSQEQLFRKGYDSAAAGQLDQAILVLWEAKRRAPDEGLAYRDLAYLYTLKRWFVVGEHEIDQALRRLKGDSRTHYVAGVVKVWLGKYDQGERHLRRAVLLDPGNEAAREAFEKTFGEDI